MKYAPKHAMQAGGATRRWSNPNRTFNYSLVKIDFDCEADPYPGILVLTDRNYKSASALAVKNLRKELPTILEPLDGDTIAYWRIVQDDAERDSLLVGLTKNPIFDDILG